MIRTTAAGVVLLAALFCAFAPPGGSVALPDGGDAASDLRALEEELRNVLADFQQAYGAIEDPDERRAYLEAWDPRPAFVEAFAEKAREYAGTPGAAPFLARLVEMDLAAAGRGPARELSETTREALRVLARDHPTAPATVSFVRNAHLSLASAPPSDVVAVMDVLLAHSQREGLTRWARFARARARLSDPQATPEAIAEARAAVQAAAGGRGPLAQEAEGFLFEFDHLRIGKVAPNITGKDLDGVEFSLEDYRGKVVLLDFWGDW